MKELAKQYDPSQVEDRIYQFWLDGGYFHTKADPDKKPYTIVMPPPNVTGQLHMGHAVDNTMQDILIRTKRMQGYAALWVPGTDHASIATEAKVVVRGDSMEPRIQDGDLALVHKQDTLENGDLGVLIYGDEGEGTLKRYIQRGNCVVLQPFNPAYHEMVIKGEELNHLHIAGRVVETKAKW